MSVEARLIHPGSGSEVLIGRVAVGRMATIPDYSLNDRGLFVVRCSTDNHGASMVKIRDPGCIDLYMMHDTEQERQALIWGSVLPLQPECVIPPGYSVEREVSLRPDGTLPVILKLTHIICEPGSVQEPVPVIGNTNTHALEDVVYVQHRLAPPGAN